MIGETLGSYRILSQLGAGGMGVVYYAEHVLIGRKAAIKLLLPELSTNAELVDRFFNEARAATVINHPGLVDVFDFGYHPANGSAFIVMSFLEGESLAARLRRDRALPAALVVALGRQIAQALAAAHDHQIVHRDLKPDNLFLCPDPAVPIGIRAKVLDFGIAKLAGDGSHSLKTRTGSVMGTPTYMAPEQCRGAGAVDRRADIYALGCILYEMLCGRPPFVGEGVGEILGKHMYEAPPPPRAYEPSVPPLLEAVVLRALAKKPEDRQQTMGELVTELEAALPRGDGAALMTPPAMPAVAAPSTPNGPTPVTTLQGGAGQVAPYTGGAAPRRSRRWIAIAGGVVVVGAAAVVIAMLVDPGRPHEEDRTGAGLADLDEAGVATAAPGTTVPDAAPAPPPPAAVDIDAAAEPARRATVTLAIESVPSGAEVFAADGRKLGTTPFSQDTQAVPGEVVFVIKRAGYEDQRIALDATARQSGTVTLKKVRKKRSGGASGGGALNPFEK